MTDLPAPQSPAELQRVIAAEREGGAVVVLRDGAGELVVVVLAGERMTIGRGPANAICLAWDGSVSRTHAELERVGEAWILDDDGLSTHGTWVNGTRLSGRRRLQAGDVIRVGDTAIGVRVADAGGLERTAMPVSPAGAAVALSPAQAKVVRALCAPILAGRLTPATNQEIADELVLSVEAVKTHMKAIFVKLALADVPQNEKRARVVQRALRDGLA